MKTILPGGGYIPTVSSGPSWEALSSSTHDPQVPGLQYLVGKWGRGGIAWEDFYGPALEAVYTTPPIPPARAQSMVNTYANWKI